MLTWNLVQPPSPHLPPRASKHLEAALAVLGEDTQVVLHRVAVIDRVRVAYDVWTWGRPSAESPHVLAMRDLDAQDLARPSKRIKNRFLAPSPTTPLEAWFYDDTCLLGRVLIISAERPKGRALRAARDHLLVFWKALLEYAPAAAPRGTIVTDAQGRVVSCDDEALQSLSEGPALATLIASSVTRSTGPSLVLTGRTAMQLRPLSGPQPGWLLQLRPAPPLLLAPDAVLTPTQRAVAEYAAVGATVDEIARTLDAGRETIRSHMKEIYRRLDVANRVELARALT